jgi:hypothetical protein
VELAGADSVLGGLPLAIDVLQLDIKRRSEGSHAQTFC